MSVIKSGHKSRAKAEASRRIAARFTPPGIQSHPLPGVNMGLSMPNLIASSPALMPEGYAAVAANPSQVTMSLVPASHSIGRSFNPFDAAPSPVGLISFDPTRDAEPQIHLYDGMVEWQKASKPKATKKKTPRVPSRSQRLRSLGSPRRAAPLRSLARPRRSRRSSYGISASRSRNGRAPGRTAHGKRSTIRPSSDDCREGCSEM